MVAVARLQVGIAGVLDDPEDEQPGGMCRDELMFYAMETVAQDLPTEDYEVREPLHGDLPLACWREGDDGPLVVVSRTPDIGGAVSREEAAPLLARLDALGRDHLIPDHLRAIVPFDRALLMPPPSLRGVFELEPLEGVGYVNLVDALLALKAAPAIGSLKKPIELLEFCRDELFVVSFKRR